MKKLLASALLPLCFACETQAQAIYTHPRDLLIEAIQNGSAAGIMTGPVADHFTSKLESRSPLQAKASVVKRYKQQGCARLELILTKDQVPTPKGMTQATMRSQLNYCLDGKPPEQAL